jgi:transposase-like protein
MPKVRPLPSSYSITQRWTEDDAHTVLAAQDASGLSVAAFAAREGFDPQRLYFWRRRFGSSAEGRQTPTFIEVRAATARECVEVVLRSGCVIRVTESIDPGVLRRLIDALEQDPAC